MPVFEIYARVWVEVTPPSAIQLLLRNDRVLFVRSTVLVEAIEHLCRLERGDSAVSDPTFTGGRLRFIVRSTVLEERSVPSLFGERGDSAVSDPTSTRRRSGFCRQIYCPGRSDRVPSSFGEVTPPSAIQLLLRDDQTFSVRSTALVGAIGHLCRALPSAIQLLLGDDRAFAVKSTALVEAIEYLGEIEAKLHRHHHLERWRKSCIIVILERGRQSCTINIILERQRRSCTVVVLLGLQHIEDEVEFIFSASTFFRGRKAASASMKPKVFKLA
ncbi:hypothetical protein E5676_scaffold436G001270 [Cucumis melo var. makuwa]|uniref:Uncharacterized protein n=1 Tax=Cucumis melo var. makuwa TaxID=1194695 RepID=A0A5D3DQE9_CUCMM|nr:hypothetical protein E5676_scaffold436G001270 [Cucumis melo var. makuwa]